MAKTAKVILAMDEDHLTPSQRGFVNRIIAGKRPAQAYRESYPNEKPENAHLHTWRLTATDGPVLRAIVAGYKKTGLTQDTIKKSAHVYIERGKRDYRWASAGVSALRFAGQFLGMIRGDGEGSGNQLALTLNILALDGDSISERARLLAEAMAGSIEKATSVGKETVTNSNKRVKKLTSNTSNVNGKCKGSHEDAESVHSEV